jgi:hypothetical protein
MLRDTTIRQAKDAMSQREHEWTKKFEPAGFAIIPDLISRHEVLKLVRALEQPSTKSSSIRQRGRATYAMRNLLESVAEVQSLAQSTPVLSLMERVLGRGAFPVRGLLFDKSRDANWKVAWHQDLSIAVRRKIDVPGFGPWSLKANAV